MLDHEVWARLYRRRAGRMAEWLCRGLQILVQRFDSASGLNLRLAVLALAAQLGTFCH